LILIVLVLIVVANCECCIRGTCFASGIPLVYELNKDLRPVKHYYTASDAEVKAAIDKVAAQEKAAPAAAAASTAAKPVK
jgi:hypothetical protein